MRCPFVASAPAILHGDGLRHPLAAARCLSLSLVVNHGAWCLERRLSGLSGVSRN